MAFIDTILTVAIVLGILLVVIARISGQTIVELFRDLSDFLKEKKEESFESIYN